MTNSDSNKPHEIAFGKVPSGCFVVTTGGGASASGFLASWVQQVSFNPLALMICIKDDRPILEIIKKEETFTVSIISKGNRKVFQHFAKGLDMKEAEANGIQTALGTNGIPYLKECVGHLECKVISMAKPGDHYVIFGEVVGGGMVGGEPYIHVRKSATNY